MKVLVTGATGFVGNYVIKELNKRPEIQLIATSKSREKAEAKSWFSKVTYLPMDIRKLPDNPYNYFGKPDKLIHLAWEGLPDFKGLFHIEENFWFHYRFLKNLVEEGLKDVTITGTCLEYGYINGCLSEDLPTNPHTPYGLAKDSLRRFLVELKKQQNFTLKWLRLFYMYGKGQNEKSLFSQLESALDRGDKTFNMSKGEQLRDFLPIEEVAQTIVGIALQQEEGIFNCCSGQPTSVLSMVERVMEQKGKKIQLNKGYYPYPDYEPMAFWGDSHKTTKVLKHAREVI